MRIYLILALLASSLVIGKSTFAQEVPVKAPEAPAAVTETVKAPEVPTAVTETVKRVQQLLRVKSDKASVTTSPITGLYEVVIGGEVIYITADGRHFVIGNIYESKSARNLTDAKRAELRIAALNELKEADMVVFAPEKETLYTINVFTDVDCPYCSKFHNQVPELNKAGIKVRYLAFPRAGVGSKTYKTMVSVWCAEDKQQALTDAKARREVKPATCENPVAQQYELGQRIGITGTPAMVLSDGELVPGYVPAKKLIGYLQQK